jgi:hypothetical protein
LQPYPEFGELVEQVRRRYPPVHRARVAFTVPEKDLFHEGLAVDSDRRINPGEHNTLAGIDGMYWYKGSLLGVQYGTGAHRVMRWRLSSDGLRVASAEVFEYRTALVSFPTTGAVTRGNFYFIANTGIANLKDDKVVDPNKLEPVNVAVVPLD